MAHQNSGEFCYEENPVLRILLSHSPDQLAWAREQGFQLMLAGHNHGGQIRLPMIGPIVTPSLHGVKYASGVFDESPTVMHVSRGISGDQPLRWNCPPELTRVVLKCSSLEQRDTDEVGWKERSRIDGVSIVETHAAQSR